MATFDFGRQIFSAYLATKDRVFRAQQAAEDERRFRIQEARQQEILRISQMAEQRLQQKERREAANEAFAKLERDMLLNRRIGSMFSPDKLRQAGFDPDQSVRAFGTDPQKIFERIAGRITVAEQVAAFGKRGGKEKVIDPTEIGSVERGRVLRELDSAEKRLNALLLERTERSTLRTGSKGDRFFLERARADKPRDFAGIEDTDLEREILSATEEVQLLRRRVGRAALSEGEEGELDVLFRKEFE